MAEESKKSSGKGWLIAITIILFIINAWKFINNPGSEVPILSILFNIFNMIIYLAIIILILHKNEMKFEGYFQNHLKIKILK